MTLPDTPAPAAELAVDMISAPLLVTLDPVVIEIKPPVAVEEEVMPALKIKAPPVPELPDPTVIVIAPPLPEAAVPVPISRAPLFPLVAEPELITIDPLTPPVVPALGVVIEIDPVDVAP
jgi:hypothetical protein